MRVDGDARAEYEEGSDRFSSSARHMLNLSNELWMRLRRTALARDQPPEELATDLLARGLEREAHRTLAETSLESLTPRERQVVSLTLSGLTNRQIAAALVISPETVKTHLRHTLEKFQLRSKADLRLLLRDLDSSR